MGEPTVGPVPIHQAMAEAMRSIGAVAKRDHNSQQNFNFRGIDSVVNAVGPALREHGIVMLPEAGVPTVDHYESRGGASMTHVLLPVAFTFVGPAGDSVTCHVIGEASDAGDKVMSKAHSVAWRIAMLEVFAIPTDEPDPDAEAHERAPAPDVNEPFVAIGWDSRLAYDAALKPVKKAAGSLNDESKAHLKAWWEAEGLAFPLDPDAMVNYGNKVDELAELEKVAES